MHGFEKLSDQERKHHLRNLCRNNLFFLLCYGLKRKDCNKRWLYDRCNEVQHNPNGYLDLWAREHYKSTIITFAKTIQDILASHGDDPLPVWQGREITVGIFSHTRPNAKGFLKQIKREFEANELLKEWFPDILWNNTKEAPKWSEDDGIILRRKSNPKEATVEAWGVVDGQPIGKHFDILVYDDIVTRESVNTPDQIQKTTEMLELSFSLGAEGGARRFIGTRYHFNDSYKTVMERGTALPRIYTATIDGTIGGEPVLLSRESLSNKRRDMGAYTFACQMLQNPVADNLQGFKREWIQYYDNVSPAGMNIYMVVDAANSKKASSDYTAMWVVGYGGDKNLYVLDIIRDRLNLTERGAMVMHKHRKWKPIKSNGMRYEKYGLMGDVDYIRSLQADESYRFEVLEVGGSAPKNDRIRRLVPWFEQGRIFFPRSLHYTNYEGKTVDLVSVFIEQEYCAFPVSAHDDMMDALSRLMEPDYPLVAPNENKTNVSMQLKAGYGQSYMGY